MKRNEILEKLKDILITADGNNMQILSKFDENSNLFTDLGLTSVNMLFMVIAIEEEFGIFFDDVSINDFSTIGDVITYIEGKLQ